MESGLPAARSLFHVTPAVNLPSVLTSGLLTAPPARNFACGPVIFLTEREEDAHRWAAEIARQRGEATRFALLAVDPTGLTLIGSPAASTEIGVAQTSVRSDLAPGRLTLIDEFVAAPAVNRHRAAASPAERGLLGRYECPACGCEYQSAAGLQSHIDDWCEGDDLDD